jgi:fatty-acyl-CoA synthase
MRSGARPRSRARISGLIAEYLARGVPLVQGYGLSEAAPVVLLLDERAAARKIGAAGRPALFVDIDVVDADGRSCSVGTVGELLVRGPNVTPGYWRDPAATALAIRDGWLHTGDAVRVDADGDLWIVGRMGDAFEIAGEIVHPGEIERILLLHPAVADAAAVPRSVGADTEPIVFVVLEDGATATGAELIDHARAALAPHEVPRSVRLVDSLPRSSVGKLLRPELVRILET